MGSMDRCLGGIPMSTTTLHYQLKDVWRSPRGTVLRIEALATVAIALSFLVVAFGSCRRWSNSWFVQKGFLAAQVLSLSLGTYSIGLMQSSPVKSEMYPIWAVSLLTLFGCVDPITNYVGLDYKGPLSRMIFQLCLYCGYVLVMSVSTISNVVGNAAICVLCTITFFKGFHRSLALVLPSKMRYDLGQRISVSPETGALAGHVAELEALIFTPEDESKYGGLTTMGDVHLSCHDTDEHGLVSIITSTGASSDNRTNIEDVCLGYYMCRLLQRRFLGLDTEREMKEKRRRFKRLIGHGDSIDYKWALKVIEVELAFLYEVFFTSNEFLHMHDANTASFWAFASFAAICFVGVVAAIPGAMASRYRSRTGGDGTSIQVVDTTRADLIVTLVILVSLALLQLVQLIRWWTSNWARAVFVIDYACYRKMRLVSRHLNPHVWYRRICRWWKRMKVRVAIRMDWFDNKYLWQDKLRQYSLVEASVRSCTGTVASCFLTPFWVCAQLPGMGGLSYVGLVLGELLLSSNSAGAAVKLHDDVKASIAEFLGTIKSRRIVVEEWSSLFLQNGLAADLLQHLPYSTATLWVKAEDTDTDTDTDIDTVAASDTFAFTHRVMVWHVVTCYCEQVEQLEHADGTGGGGSSSSRDKNRRVAIALSKYCAYLVVSAPELLLGPPAETKRAFQAAKGRTKKALQGQRNVLEAAVPHQRARPAFARSTFAMGAYLGKRLLDKTTTPTDGATAADHWELLARLWVQTLLYAAPYGDVQSHMQHLSQGGEFITHLWALLYHLGIDSWERREEEEGRQPAAPAAESSSREAAAAAEEEEDAGESSREAAQIQEID